MTPFKRSTSPTELVPGVWVIRDSKITSTEDWPSAHRDSRLTIKQRGDSVTVTLR